MKSEFENLIGKEISQQDYEKIELVYMYYPQIKDKEHIARLYQEFGMAIIEDMIPRARQIKELEDKIYEFELVIQGIKEEIKRLRNEK